MILITGGSGYLGQALVRALVGAGHRVRLLVRRDLRAGEAPQGVDVRFASLTDPAAVGRAFEGCSRAFHLAAVVRRWLPRREEFEEINVLGLKTMIEASRRAGVDRFIYTSSFLALGPTDGSVHDEDSPRLRLREANAYADSKRRAEAIAAEAAACGFPIITLYPGVLYGPGPRTDGNLIGQALIRHLRNRLPGLIGGGERLWCLAYVDDVVRGHLGALAGARPGDRFILGGENVSLREVFERLARIAGVAAPGKAIPYWMARLAGYLHLWRAVLTGRPPEITPDEIEIYTHDWAYSSARAAEVLGYRTTPLDEGLAATLAWARDEIREMERGR
ncbi:MAG: NAD-dependent epimerase/dehydratase family protein [Acidobacteriota bacterium]